ncbi:MAG: NAD(P)H-hydrate dehydratase [Miltoncostaeaceae bacterium]
MPSARSSTAPPLPGCTPLFDAAAMREADRRASEAHSMPSILLMERAGLATAQVVRARFADHRAAWVLVGPGNNGGDGMVVARHLAEAGWSVRALAPGGREPAGADSEAMVAVAASLGIPVEALGDQRPPAGTLVVDALLGTGARGLPRGPVAEAIDWLLGLDAPVVAVDIPSGIEADTGACAGRCARAALTVTYHGDMVGLAVTPGRDCAGEVVVADIGIPSAVALEPAAWRAGAAVCGVLPARSAGADKYAAGAVLVVAGSPGLTGAACLAARATLRAGAGLAVLAVPATVQAAVAGQSLEVMCAGLPDQDGHLAPVSVEEVLSQAGRVAAVAIGPGLGRAPATTAALAQLLARLSQPVVLDADALWHLAEDPGMLAGRTPPTILTPHAGEAARLLGTDRQTVEAARLRSARDLAVRFGAVVVLKGAGTITVGTEGPAVINDTGSSALATAGTGDVLTGTVAALLASGMEPLGAAAGAVALHGRAGDLAARGAGTIASDVLEALPRARSAA